MYGGACSNLQRVKSSTNPDGVKIQLWGTRLDASRTTSAIGSTGPVQYPSTAVPSTSPRLTTASATPMLSQSIAVAPTASSTSSTVNAAPRLPSSTLVADHTGARGL